MKISTIEKFVPGVSREQKIFNAGIFLGGAAALGGCLIGLRIHPIALSLTKEQLQVLMTDPTMAANWKSGLIRITLKVSS